MNDKFDFEHRINIPGVARSMTEWVVWKCINGEWIKMAYAPSRIKAVQVASAMGGHIIFEYAGSKEEAA